MFTHVVSRLNEMEDMLHALEDESVDKLKAKLDVRPPAPRCLGLRNAHFVGHD
jgi:hypothetical protein